MGVLRKQQGSAIVDAGRGHVNGSPDRGGDKKPEGGHKQIELPSPRGCSMLAG
jgi:hypothetical protein